MSTRIDFISNKGKYTRIKDYSSLLRNKNTQDCLTCSNVTFFKDGICGNCRTEVPTHIPHEQVKRYILRIREKGKVIHYA